MKLFSKKTVNNRKLYAVTQGVYVGQFFVFINDNPINDSYQILSLPDCLVIEISEKDIKEGISKKILEPVETLPEEVRQVCVAEYNHRKKLQEEKKLAIIDKQE